MVQSNDFMRAMKAGEEVEIEKLLQKAFSGNDEARLVRLLRKQRVMAGEMVVGGSDGIVGYLALSEFVSPKGWLCLAPVAVRPDMQGRGIGRRMIGLLSEWARLAGKTVAVLGEVEFYERGGFSVARAAKLTSPYPVEHTLLAGPGGEVPQAELVYPKAFSAL